MQIRKIKGKKGGGEWTAEEIGKLIVTIAGAILLILLAYKLISPYFNKDVESAKAYLGTFSKQVDVANAKGTGEFEIWQKGSIYLVIFGNDAYINDGSNYFFHAGSKNTVCFCIYRVKACQYCMNLGSPVKFEGQNKGIVYGQQKVYITKENGYYVLKR